MNREAPCPLIKNDKHHLPVSLWTCQLTNPALSSETTGYVILGDKQFGFERDSVVLLEQLRTIDKVRILEDYNRR